MHICGVTISEAEFYAGHLCTKNGENVWIRAERALYKIAYIAAKRSLEKSKLFYELNEAW